MNRPSTPRDFAHELRHDRCWDAGTQRIFEQRGEPAQDRILQTREELLAFCQFIEQNQVVSYLEVGIWTGRLVCALHRLFAFDTVAACDDGYARRFGFELHLPEGARFFEGNSRGRGYRRFRAALGQLDLVLIDADHSYRGVQADFAINRAFPQRFLAFHDISGANRYTVGVRRFWRELRATGQSLEILRPHREIGAKQSTMGIGIWSDSERPRLSLSA